MPRCHESPSVVTLPVVFLLDLQIGYLCVHGERFLYENNHEFHEDENRILCTVLFMWILCFVSKGAYFNNFPDIHMQMKVSKVASNLQVIKDLWTEQRQLYIHFENIERNNWLQGISIRESFRSKVGNLWFWAVKIKRKCYVLKTTVRLNPKEMFPILTHSIALYADLRYALSWVGSYWSSR